MGRHRQMPGKIYKVNNHDDLEAQVEFTYLCPYCNQDTSVQKIVSAEGFDLLESGGFYKLLECEHCNKTSDVRFWLSNKM